MKIAIPIAEGKLAMHFGHAGQFCLIEVDEKTKKIKNKEMLTPPPHEPGVLPKWLSSLNTNIIISGGMGQMAVQLFQQNNINVVIGAPSEEPEKIVTAFLENNLEIGENVCGHDPNSPCNH
ncbi:MAG: ATPase [Desulfobacteraceae bacterium 4572_130]|nr:MAG: ATPase [Desulfobacteraceae bacterium 4572_130]